MNCIKKIWLFCIIILSFNSCGFSKGLFLNDTSGFKNPTRYKELEAKFYNYQDIKEYNTLLWVCNVFDKNVKQVRVSFVNSSQLVLNFEIDSVHSQRILNGKMKRNFFEIYLKNKKVFIPLIYTFFDVERIRIGLTPEGNLMLRGLKYQTRFYTPFLGYDSAKREHTYIYKRVEN